MTTQVFCGKLGHEAILITLELRSSQNFNPVLLFKQQDVEDDKLGKEDFPLCNSDRIST